MSNELTPRAEDGTLTETQKRALAFRQHRAERPGAVLLADCSGSMAIIDDYGGNGCSRMDNLSTVLGHLLSRMRLQRLIAFNSEVYDIPLSGNILLPKPSSMTDLAYALEYVESLPVKPTRIIILCDGYPDNADAACAVVARLQLPVDAYFVGDDRDDEARAVMQRLSDCGAAGGRSGKFNMAGDQAQIADEIVLAITHDKGPRR